MQLPVSFISGLDNNEINIPLVLWVQGIAKKHGAFCD